MLLLQPLQLPLPLFIKTPCPGGYLLLALALLRDCALAGCGCCSCSGQQGAVPQALLYLEQLDFEF